MIFLRRLIRFILSFGKTVSLGLQNYRRPVLTENGEKIHQFSGMMTTIFVERNRYFGLDGEFLEVFASRKKNE